MTRDLLYRINELDKFFREQFNDPNPARRCLSYVGLMAKFGWGKNTIIKDIATMKLTYSAPLEFIEERGGWGYTRSVANLPTILMSEGDLTVLCASWGALERRRNGEWGARVRPVVEKVMNAMGQGFSFDFATISERIAFRSSGYQDALDIQIFEAEFMLTEHGGDDGFAARPFNLDAILRDSLGIHRGGKVADVEVHFHRSNARYVRESFWHDSQQFSTAPDGRLCLKMRVALNPELEARILRYGPKAEVIAPQKLLANFTAYAREYAQLYLRPKVPVSDES